jgi:glycosyltransferase involved in cell wall biosynthesis
VKVAVVTNQAPFVRGGAELLTEWLAAELRKRGHQAQIVRIPFHWHPSEKILEHMLAARLLELGNTDRVVAMKFPAYYVRHESKVLWLLHQFRQAYELWGTPYQDIPSTPEGERVRQAIVDADNRFLREPERIYTNSTIVGDRLRSSNGIDSQVLYPPLGDPNGYRSDSFADYVFYPSRLTEGKRQHLLVEAMAHVRGGARLVLAGRPDTPEYLRRLQSTIERLGVGDRVELRSDWLSELEKRDLFANALACAYTPYDEDSYGYVSLESFHSSKPVLTCTDSGGTLELITDGENGRVLPPEPEAIAEAIDEFSADKKRAAIMGEAGRQRLADMQISWDAVVNALVS